MPRIRLNLARATKNYEFARRRWQKQFQVDQLDLEAIEVGHRVAGRIVERHSLAELCGYCEDLISNSEKGENQNGR